MSLDYLLRTVAQNHRPIRTLPTDSTWQAWHRYPSRARIWFIKGGPGQGKSTLTQYLAQLQRAAFILGADGPAATPQQRAIAEDIQRVAKLSNIWPISPRIPVFVELKDFAKWFGDRNDSQPHGVLTFLTERLSQRLEDTVYAGTLRRAFSEARWLFLFDGLDEVPSDVKDKVSAELIAFIDDMLVDCNSDAFVVCTSRPQGYSGQLSSLDTAEIELASLSADQALACAIPVIKIDRSEDESRQYIETLKESLQSSSIKEIMTTPLQAHIMAVVVRDGGRPPDRRWRLFTNFYQVIKKREANRNLPDKRISNLLRSGDKVLKALHNRIGFELHARAEVSNGAQTSISRVQLKDIIWQTVSELQTSNVEETVETLMAATTDRLVLVNTPESGEYVRFDIRPLQEFFAAEFLYEDASVDQLGTRLSIIAGDSHWREVMHFVLSALVENSRRTDLAVAVEKLAFVDERTGGAPARLLYRRIAAGAVLAARLLAEGVLDQDKRIRQQFKRCIEPLFGSTDEKECEELAKVNGIDTSAWLVDALADALSEQSESECIGAAYILCLLLSDNHERREEVETSINQKSPAFKGGLFLMLQSLVVPVNPWTVEYSRRLPSWVFRTVLKALISPGWRSLGAEGLQSAFVFISGIEKDFANIAVNLGMDANLVEFLSPLIQSDEDDEMVEEIVADIVHVSRVRIAPQLDPKGWSEALRSAIIKAPGVFSLIEPTVAMAFGNRNRKALNALRRARGLLKSLPPRWRVIVSNELLNRYQSSTNELSQDEYHGLGFRPGFSKEEFEELLRANPSLALHVLVRYSHLQPDMTPEWLNSDEVGKVVQACIAMPELLARYPSSWGMLVSCDPSGAIRKTLRVAAAEWEPLDHAGMEVDPFRLDLPKEASLLPPLLDAIVTRRHHYISFRRGEASQRPFAQLVQAFVPDIAELLRLLGNKRLDGKVIGAAAMMCLRHPDCPDARQDECLRTIVCNYTADSGGWYLRAAACSMEELVNNEREPALDAMGCLLRASSSSPSERYNLNSSLATWRERSKAPVNKFGISQF